MIERVNRDGISHHVLNTQPLGCSLLIEFYSISYRVFSQSNRSVDLIDRQWTPELLLDIVLDSSKEQSLIELFQVLDCNMLQASVCDVVSLKLIFGGSKHSLNRVERGGVLWDGES